MNPSYNSGSSDSSVNTPGVKPGVIASGPDPADAPAPQPLSTPSPTMTPRKKLRLPTGGRSGSISTIGGSSRGGSKKGLIIGALAAIIVLIVVLVVVMMMGGKKGSGNTNDGAKTLNSAFINVTNYLLAGDISIAANLSEMNTDDAAFVKIAKTGTYGEQEKYFSVANDHITVLKKFTSGNDELTNDVETLGDLLLVVEDVSAISYTNILADKYVENTETGIESYGRELKTIDKNSYVMSVVEIEKNLMAKTKRLYDDYNKNNCIKDGIFNDECADELLVKNAEIMNEFNETTNLRLKLRKNDEMLFDMVLTKLEGISEVIR